MQLINSQARKAKIKHEKKILIQKEHEFFLNLDLRTFFFWMPTRTRFISIYIYIYNTVYYYIYILYNIRY